MKTGAFKKHVLLLAASNTVLQAMAFVYRMALTAYAGAAALGLNSLVMQIYSIVVSVCISGLSVAVTATAAAVCAGREAKAGLRVLLRRAIALYCLLWLAAAAPVFLLRGRIARHALGDPNAADTLALMLLCIFMTGLENVLKSLHIGAGRVGRCAASELCEQGVRFALVILLLARLPHPNSARTVFFIMLGMTASELVSVGFLTVSFFNCFGFSRGKRPAEGTAASDLVRIAAPVSAQALASTVFASAAALLLPKYLTGSGMSEGGALSLIGIMNAVAVPVMMLPMAGVSALASALMPAIAAERASGGSGSKRLALRALRLTGAVGIAVTLVTIPAAPFIAQRLFGVKAELTLFAALGFEAVTVYLQTVASAVMNGAKLQGKALVFTVTGEVYSLLMMLLLTPAWGVYGYIAATTLGGLLRLALNIIVIKRL